MRAKRATFYAHLSKTMKIPHFKLKLFLTVFVFQKSLQNFETVLYSKLCSKIKQLESFMKISKAIKLLKKVLLKNEVFLIVFERCA